jgi:hypothetical protein
LAAVAREVGEVLGVDATHLGRFDPDGTVAATVREIGIRFSIGVPISLEGRAWGVMIVSTRSTEPFPPETESRLEDFSELLATAISNASAHDRLRRLADEEAALRRVATLVAQQTPPAGLFAAIAGEIGELLGVESIEMVRYEEERFAAAAAGWGRLVRAVPDGTRVLLGGRNVTSLLPDPARRTPGRLRRRERRDRRARQRGRRALGRRHAELRGRSAVGRDDRRQHARRGAAAGHRGAHRPVHRAHGHGDRQRRGAARPRG